MYNIIEKWKANPSKIFVYENDNKFTGKKLLYFYNNVKNNISFFSSYKYIILSGKNSLNWVLCYLACKSLGKELVIIPTNTLHEVLRVFSQLPKYSLLISDEKIKKIDIKQKFFHDIIKDTLKNKNSNPNIEIKKQNEIIFTSGTTGNPKGVILSEKAILHTVNILINNFRQTNQDLELLSMPFSHSFGLARLRCSLYANCVLYISDGLKNIPLIYKNIISLPITGLSFVPSAMEIFKSILKKDVKNISNKINYIELGSSRISKDLRIWLKTNFPNSIIYIHYGTTEASRSFFLKLGKNDDLLDSNYLGIISKKTEFKLVPNSKIAGNNNEEIFLKGNNLADGYLHSSSLKCTKFKDGWFNTSDIGFLKGKKLFLKGRSDNLINVGGRKIPAEKLEKDISSLHFIKDCLVFSVEDAVFEQRIAAIIVFDNKIGENPNIVNKLKKHLRKYPNEEYPKIAWTSKSIPLSHNGKKLRNRNQILMFTENLNQII